MQADAERANYGLADWPGDPTPGAIVSGMLWRTLGITDGEFSLIQARLGRIPTWTELGMFSVAWSEHCAYKHSKDSLKRLPTEGAHLLMGPGESAGVLDVGGGWAVAVRLESHNHPSYVEPYQGAATGVGGIVRDVLAAGARPIALLNSLRFGRPEASARNRYLLREVVAGIAGYGNAIGVPTVGGEVAFDDAYETNPLVNVMCVGLVRGDRIARAKATGAGNPVYLAGSRTGRDGIHGAGLLASRTFREDEGGEQRPRVQVGDPFTEKLVIEACLEALATGAVVGIQDLGAAGITAASSELAARGAVGIDLDLDQVARREPGMSPFEVMLSESQERMMLVVQQGREAEVERVFARWKVWCARVGSVDSSGRLRVRCGRKLVADLPASFLADGAPRYPAPAPRPVAAGPRGGLPGAGASRRRDADARPIRDRIAAHLGSPDGGSRAWIYTQFDHAVGVRTVLPPGHDAAVMRVLPGDEALAGPTGRAASEGRMPMVALSVDAAEWLSDFSPYAAGCEAVLEGARNVAAAGAMPIGITDGLNLGNPERPEVMQALADVVAGMGDACRAHGIPVTGGNVSMYNETVGERGGRAIKPTAVVGMVGLMRAERPVPSGFQRAGDTIVLIGAPRFFLKPDEWWPDFEQERRLVAALAGAGEAGLLRSCHDVGQEGLAVALVEAAIGAARDAGGLFVEVPAFSTAAGQVDRLLFGAASPLWVASLPASRVGALAERLGDESVHVIGTVVPGRVRLAVAGQGVVVDEELSEMRRTCEEALEKAARP